MSWYDEKFFVRINIYHSDERDSSIVLLSIVLLPIIESSAFKICSDKLKILSAFNPYAPLTCGDLAANSQKDFGGRGDIYFQCKI